MPPSTFEVEEQFARHQQMARAIATRGHLLPRDDDDTLATEEGLSRDGALPRDHVMDDEDVLQELWCVLLEARARPELREHVPQTLRRHVAVQSKHRRALHVDPSCCDREADPSDIALDRELMRRAAAEMTVRQRIEVGDFASGYSAKEIARRRRLPSANAVHASLCRARARARATLGAGMLALLGLWLLAGRLHRAIWRAATWMSEAAPTWPAVVVQCLAIVVTPAGAVAAESRVTVPSALAAHHLVQDSGARATAPPTAVRPHVLHAPPAPLHVMHVPHAGGTAATETPEDVAMTDIVAAPRDDATLVSLGGGESCRCAALLRSTDGGASWQSAPGYDAGTQLALPPDSPLDRRIAVGTEVGSGRPPALVERFGDAPSPLRTVPPGHVAFVSRTELVSAGLGAVYDVDLADPVPRPLITYAASSRPAAVAPVGDAVLVWAPPGSVPVAAPAQLTPSAPAASPLQSVVYACAASRCTVRGSVPLAGVGTMAASGDMLVLAWNSALVISNDGGRSFISATLPAPGTVLSANVAADRSVWVLLASAEGAVLAHGDGDSDWTVVPDRGAVSGLHATLALDRDRVVGVTTTTGFRCSVDSARHWSSRCPM